MRSENDITKLIQQIALAAVEQADPTSVVYGTVSEAEEGVIGKIKVDQQWEIDGEQCVIPQQFKERTIEKVKVKGSIIELIRDVADKCEVAYEIDEECERDETLVDVTTKDFLKVDDKVAITRQQGGQKFVIMGRTING